MFMNMILFSVLTVAEAEIPPIECMSFEYNIMYLDDKSDIRWAQIIAWLDDESYYGWILLFRNNQDKYFLYIEDNQYHLKYKNYHLVSNKLISTYTKSDPTLDKICVGNW